MLKKSKLKLLNDSELQAMATSLYEAMQDFNDYPAMLFNYYDDAYKLVNAEFERREKLASRRASDIASVKAALLVSAPVSDFDYDDIPF